MNQAEQSILRLKKAVLVAATLLLIIAATMLILAKTGLSNFAEWKQKTELKKKLKNPLNRHFAESMKEDQHELQRLDTFRKDITSNIEKFGTNSPEGKFMQKEMQRLEQNIEMRQTNIEENKRKLK
ncbi:MAG: hypothetical protein A2283_21045 [Lentisphaerae bacterium RIFOXYA12_FULL_48_11]|nr:MAG: hypothetical protein A2283_21045 [Lentisphaerae bacterium RIFOXYA12_FULL_48_11]